MQQSLIGSQVSLADVPGACIVINTDRDLAIVRADRKTHPHYCDIPQNVRKGYLFKVIAYCNYIARQPKDETLWHFDVAEIDAQLSADPMKSHLTMAEISNAFRRGTLGRYGDFFRLDARTFLSFIDGFLSENTHAYLNMKKKKSEGASLYLERVLEDKARVLAERMKEETK